jgi:hypothetical protein
VLVGNVLSVVAVFSSGYLNVLVGNIPVFSQLWRYFHTQMCLLTMLSQYVVNVPSAVAVFSYQNVLVDNVLTSCGGILKT